MKSIFGFGLLALTAVAFSAPSLNDPNLVVEKVLNVSVTGTGMAFIGPDDILVNHKDSGKVNRVKNQVLLGTVLDLPVNASSERGLLGITLHPDFATNKYVYLYYTYATADAGTPVSNRVSRFTWDGTSLVGEQVIIDLPVLNGPNHNGGIITFGPPTAAAADQKLFIITGDLNLNGQTQNYASGSAPDGSGMILRLNADGTIPSTAADKGPFYDVAGTNVMLQAMYAYGVRNSYGMDFDPVTGDLWDTENGPSLNDEVNRVLPAFNSGWETVMGKPATVPPLVKFSGIGTYSDPEFTWYRTVAPTALHFLRGDGLGSAYKHDCFVGGSNGPGILYHFKMNTGRTKFVLSGDLADEVLNPDDNATAIILGQGFDSIIGLTTGPDGNLYVLTYNAIYRIKSNVTAVSEWSLYQ